MRVLVADFTDNWVYGQAADTYAFDSVMAEKLKQANPVDLRVALEGVVYRGIPRKSIERGTVAYVDGNSDSDAHDRATKKRLPSPLSALRSV